MVPEIIEVQSFKKGINFYHLQHDKKLMNEQNNTFHEIKSAVQIKTLNY